MKKHLLTVVYALLGSALCAQPAEQFNSIYHHTGNQNIRGVMTTETGYLLASESLENGAWAAQLLVLDPYGSETGFRHYLFHPNGHGIGLNSLKKDHEGNNWMCGFINTGEDSSMGYVFKFNDQGDSLAFIATASHTQPLSDLLPVGDDLVVIGKDWRTGYSKLRFAKINTDGTVIWERIWDYFPGNKEDGYIVTAAPDGGYLIGAVVWHHAGNADPWLIKTDSLGNVEWHRLFENSEWLDGYASVHMGTDGFIYVGCGSGKGLDGHSRTINKNYFAKLSLTNQLIWEREFGPLNASNPIGQLKEDREGNILAVTDVFFDLNGIIEQGGLLMKVSPAGDSLWSKTFIYNYDTSLVGRQYCWAMDTTLDGGIITGGFIQQYDTNGGLPIQEVWAVKFDSLGCFDSVYSCPVGIEEAANADATAHELRLWPNPNHGHFSVAPASLEGFELAVFDAMGRSVAAEVSEYQVTIKSAPAGVYIVQMTNERITLRKQFILLSE